MSGALLKAEVMWWNVFVSGELQKHHCHTSFTLVSPKTPQWHDHGFTFLSLGLPFSHLDKCKLLQTTFKTRSWHLAFSPVTTEPQSVKHCFRFVSHFEHIAFNTVNKWDRAQPRLVLHQQRVYSSPLHQLSISSGSVSAPVSPGTAWWWQSCPFSIGATCNVPGHVRAVRGPEQRSRPESAAPLMLLPESAR